MDQDLLGQLKDLASLNLPPDLVREIIEHDKWKVREKHRHEREMKLLEIPEKRKQVRDTFNQDTSYGKCKGEHEGLIAKAVVAEGALVMAKRLENPDNLPLPLLSLLITISWCGERSVRWPKAKDISSLESLVDEFNRMRKKYGENTLEGCIKLLSRCLDIWNTSVIEDKLISEDPLYTELHKSYPFIDRHTFETCYNSHNGDFVSASLHILRKEFRNNPPTELSDVKGWKQRWQQYLPEYLKLWQEDLREIKKKARG